MLNPAVMKGHANASWAAFKKWGTKEIKAGSISPFFAGCAMVGFVGYAVEYSFVGKYHVAHKQAIVAKAMAAEGHH